jgi:hypothetical protein
MNVAAPNPKPKRKLPSPNAEERANDLERRRELGQFFTPVGVAGFMWDFLEKRLQVFLQFSLSARAEKQ